MAVADIKTFLIYDITIHTGIHSRIVSSVGCVVSQALGECDRELAGGIDVTENYVSQCIAGLGTDIPSLNNGRHLVEPRHRIGVSGEVNHNGVGVGGYESFDHCVLVIGKREVGAVGTFSVLMVGFIETANEDHHVSFFRSFDSVGDQLVGASRIVQILAGGHTVVFAGHVTDISALISYVHAATGSVSHDSFERKGLSLNLQR